MGFVAKNLGKYMNIDESAPEAAGVCDITGFVFPHRMLRKQMEWRGDKLCWTGLMVGEPFLDKPQPQNRPPPVKDDPTVVNNPRLPQNYKGLPNTNESYAQIYAELQRVSFQRP